MSQVYRVSLRDSISRQVKAADRVQYPIHLTPILPEADMRDLLRAALLADGFVADEAGKLVGLGEAGETITVDLERLEVTAELADEKEVKIDILALGADERRGQAQKAAEADLSRRREGAEQAADRQADRIQRELTKKLADSESSRSERLNRVIQQVYAEALKRKAHQLGDVTEVQESTSPEGQYQLVIKVSQ